MERALSPTFQEMDCQLETRSVGRSSWNLEVPVRSALSPSFHVEVNPQLLSGALNPHCPSAENSSPRRKLSEPSLFPLASVIKRSAMTARVFLQPCRELRVSVGEKKDGPSQRRSLPKHRKDRAIKNNSWTCFPPMKGSPRGRCGHSPSMNQGGKEEWEGRWRGVSCCDAGVRGLGGLRHRAPSMTQTDRAAAETLELDKLSWPLWEWGGGGRRWAVGAALVTQE
ncbi:hypothetical protein EYF80_000833 [Liparis tanakae]|uniref:Uncharacterized protein n=1 Tax=Liparis tanakae TaxID=230148 RepID=A0A4Z2JFC4_9TELE|nr:hypothetical protein EYF80_000833 [Liparis tanakae]